MLRYSLPALMFGASLISGCTGLGGAFCDSDHPDPRVAAMMRDSCEGNRLASMQLGLWHEGNGDYTEAAKYLEIASTPSSGRNYVYVPPAGDVPGFTMPVDGGGRHDGLPEAQYRLGMLYKTGQGVPQSTKKARKYFKLAAEQGHSAAKLELAKAE